MATYAIYNYQFEKIVEHASQGEFEGMGSVVMTADEAFPRKQDIFGEILKRDFLKSTEVDVIHFKRERGPKEYIHRHLIAPTDDIVVMRIANRKTQIIVDSQLKETRVDDYQNCIVIFDNRPGIQRLLIENKKRAFSDVKQLAGIMEYTFNVLLRRYSLKIRLDHLQDKRVFWQYANDRRSFPTGFRRIAIRMPYPNLERLKKEYDHLFNRARKSFDSGINLELVAPDGGEVRLNEDDTYQATTIEWLTEDAGADLIMYPNIAKRSPIVVGEKSFRAVTISDTVINGMIEDSINSTLFGSSSFDEVKRATKTGIDPDQ
ncbi:MAG: hypothetical protein K6G92_14185 [Bacteroidaceae bacterium]|nr:hypothetical protein [Bacteroidaceae bacterium]